MYPQKVFLKYMKWKNYHPIDTHERIFYFDKDIRYVLAFKENRDFKCECSWKNRDKILEIQREAKK